MPFKFELRSSKLENADGLHKEFETEVHQNVGPFGAAGERISPFRLVSACAAFVPFVYPELKATPEPPEIRQGCWHLIFEQRKRACTTNEMNGAA